MRLLGEQWIEEHIDGKTHMYKVVGMSTKGLCTDIIIKDLGIVNEEGLLPCPFCEEYPKVSSYGFRWEPKEYGIFHLCKDSFSKIETRHYATTQQAIDAWNRRT